MTQTITDVTQRAEYNIQIIRKQKISGYITGEDTGEGVFPVFVTLYNSTGHYITHTLTNSEGYYEFDTCNLPVGVTYCLNTSDYYPLRYLPAGNCSIYFNGTVPIEVNFNGTVPIEVNFTLIRVKPIHGYINYIDDENISHPIEDVDVGLDYDCNGIIDDMDFVTTTDEHGSGEYRIIANGNRVGYMENNSECESYIGGHEWEYNFTLQKIETIHGYIDDAESGEDVSGVNVGLDLNCDGSIEHTTTTNGSGLYTFASKLPPYGLFPTGNYIIYADGTPAGYSSNQTSCENYTRGQDWEVNFSLIELCNETHGSIFGKVLSPTGEPIPNAKVEALNYSNINITIDTLNNTVITFTEDVKVIVGTTYTNKDGYFVIMLPYWSYLLNATFEGVSNNTDINNPVVINQSNCPVEQNITLPVEPVIEFSVESPVVRQCDEERPTNATLTVNFPSLIKSGNITITRPDEINITRVFTNCSNVSCTVYNMPSPDEGEYNYTVNYTDIYGNKGNQPGSFEVINDTFLPEIQITGIAETRWGDNITITATITDDNPPMIILFRMILSKQEYLI